MVVKGVEIKCKKQEEENYLLMNNVVQWNKNYFNTKLKKFLIDNGTSTLEENKEINIVKINFPTTHIHSTYNTQT